MMRRFDTPIPDMQATSGQLYLLVDGGQLPDLARSLYQLPNIQTPEPVYLYPPYDALKDVSPYLVQAIPAVKQWFLNQHQPTAGFFFSSEWSQHDIGDQLRELIQVMSPYGSPVFLKMAHPEAAEILLTSHCIQLWQMMQTVWLPTREGWKIQHRPELSGKQPRSPYLLDDTQWAAIGQISWRNVQEALYQFMETRFPALLHRQEVPGLWLSDLTTQGYQLGFTTEQDLTHYLTIVGLLGEEAVSGASYPEITQLIHQPSPQTPSQRIEQAAQLAEQYHSSHQSQEPVA